MNKKNQKISDANFLFKSLLVYGLVVCCFVTLIITANKFAYANETNTKNCLDARVCPININSLKTSLPDGSYFMLYDSYELDKRSNNEQYLTYLFTIKGGVLSEKKNSTIFSKDELNKKYSVILNNNKIGEIDSIFLEKTNLKKNHPNLIVGKYLGDNLNQNINFLRPILIPGNIKTVTNNDSKLSLEERNKVIEEVKKNVVPDPFDGYERKTEKDITNLEVTNLNNNNINDFIGSYKLGFKRKGNGRFKGIYDYIFTVIDNDKVEVITYEIYSTLVKSILDIDGDNYPEIIIIRFIGGHGDNLELVENNIYAKENQVEIWKKGDNGKWGRIYKDIY